MKKTIDFELLAKFPIFDNLDEQLLIHLAAKINAKKASKYQFIYEIGVPSDKIFFLTKGVIKVGRLSNDGREVIKSIIHPLAMFGELGIAGQVQREDYARAMNENVEYFELKVSDLKEVMYGNFDLSQKVLSMVGQRLLKVERKLEGLIFKDARQRIIDFLRDTANNRGRKVGYELHFKHNLTQQDIANITGTSRQTVTSVLNELRKNNMIYFNRRSMLIRDVNALC